MPIERCTRCDRMVDLDRNVEDIVYLEHPDTRWAGKIIPVCTNCLTDQELKDLEDK